MVQIIKISLKKQQYKILYKEYRIIKMYTNQYKKKYKLNNLGGYLIYKIYKSWLRYINQ